MGSENPILPLSRELSNPVACSHASGFPGRNPDFHLFSV
ncbi:hypothetical protein MXB_2246 [Myxobolus squamalis]|nr:hypothetical protein MXB_2246 [Myxobolus squamalis]